MKWFLELKLTRLVLASAIWSLFGCEDSRYITPPTQTINATLNSAAAETSSHFSYDGRYLIYTSDRNSQRSIFLYDLQRRRLIPLPGLNQPGSMQFQADISADGRYIVYVSEQLGKTDIFLYDRSTAKSKNLTRNFIGEVRNPSISGNGRFVSFEGNRSGQWDIEIYDRGVGIDFSQPRSFPNLPGSDEQ
ncbi:MAG: biopolymer transporter [Pleurocapsa sp. MO_226.B13]|nr:biopolymer transporter [Pleurocapsa sp. MO_226.B13]